MTTLFRRTANVLCSVLIAVASVNLIGVSQVYAYGDGQGGLGGGNPNPGNNGTLKVHEKGKPSGTESNDPKVCKFNFEGFDFDRNQSGDIVVSTQPGGTTKLTLPFGPTNNSGYAQTAYINDGAAGYVLADGQYKAVLTGTNKSKVFKVQCPAQPTVSAQVGVCIQSGATNGVVNGSVKNVDDETNSSVSYTITATHQTSNVSKSTTVSNVNDGSSKAYSISGLAVGVYDLLVTGSDGTSVSTTFTITACDKQVSVAPPTRTEEACGTDKDFFTIPTSEGVDYYVNDVKYGAGTYNGLGTVAIRAEAQPGYKFAAYAATQWTYTFESTPCVITVSVIPPTFIDECGTANDKYVIPASGGVIFYIDDQPVDTNTYNGVGMVKIVAKPAAYYALTGDTEWTHTFKTTPCVIAINEVAAPNKVDECGKKNDKLIIPSVAGVKYLVNGKDATAGDYKVTGNVTVKAVAMEGYELADGVKSEWTYKFSKKQCKITICHATDSRTNPYVKIRVSKKAVDGKGKNDHTSHTGPIFNIELPKGANWGDIVPEVSGVTGQNWTEAGQAIWNADCEVETEEPEEPKYPNIRADFVCTPNGIVVTVSNDGDADGFAVVNGDKVELAPGESKDVLVEVAGQDRSADVLVYDQDEDTLVDRLIVCQGQGGAGGEEPTVPTTPTTPALPVVTPVTTGQMPTEMPQTGASNQLAQFIATLALAAATYVATYCLQGRRKLDANE